METQDISNLLALCRTGTSEEKCGAIFTLAERGAREAIPVLLELKTSTDEAVRGNVAAALGKLGSCDTAAPTLIAFLDDTSVLVRVTAIQALDELRCSESLPQLKRLLGADPDPLVRLQAAETLGALKDAAAMTPLLSALKDPDDGVRSYAAKALGQLGQQGAKAELQDRAALEQSPLVKASLLGALYQLGDETVWARWLALVDEVDDQTACTILNGISYLTLPQHASLLRSKLEAIGHARPELAAEAQSLLRRL